MEPKVHSYIPRTCHWTICWARWI